MKHIAVTNPEYTVEPIRRKNKNICRGKGSIADHNFSFALTRKLSVETMQLVIDKIHDSVHLMAKFMIPRVELLFVINQTNNHQAKELP